MSSFNDNYRFFYLASLVILLLFLSNPIDVFAFKEEQARAANNRVWSIIEGKVKFNKSTFSVEKVRLTTPKPEQLQPTPHTQHERIPSRQLQNNQFKSMNYKKEFIRKEGRKSYATNSKGRSESFLENPNAVKKFCDLQQLLKVTNTFCIRNSQSNRKYIGNTPKKRPRKKDFSDKNNFKKKQESKTFVKQLILQSDR